jgi:hypothetical protein
VVPRVDLLDLELIPGGIVKYPKMVKLGLTLIMEMWKN